MPDPSHLRCILAFLVSILLVGCGGESKEDQQQKVDGVNNLNAVAEAYFECIEKTKRPPKGPDDLRRFLDAGVDAATVFSSTRDGEPYVMAWGVDPTKHSGAQPLVIAYEKNGTGGVRMVLSNFGVIEMSESEFSNATFPPDIQP